MNHRTHLLGALCLLAGLGLSACSDKSNPPVNTSDASADTPATDTPASDTPATDTPATDTPAADAMADATTDTPQADAPADVPADVPSSAGCRTYCTQMMMNCTGANAQYDDMTACLTYCNNAHWPEGMAGAAAGNSLACRIYHSGSPAMMDARMHCPHAGPTGDNVCGSLSFRTDPPAMYRRVDRMGMPAVSTALLPSARKNAYNDVTGRTDMGTFVPDMVATLTGLHTALDRHLMAAGLTPCSMTTLVGGLPECLGQSYATGATVASLVVPDDAILVTPATMAGFPNGRRLQDPVIDVTLAVLLLRLGTGTCGMGMCSPATLASVPLNPSHNESAFLDSFPYLAPLHTNRSRCGGM